MPLNTALNAYFFEWNIPPEKQSRYLKFLSVNSHEQYSPTALYSKLNQKQKTKKMADASGKDKQMKDEMKIPDPFFEVEKHAGCIGQSAGQQKPKRQRGHVADHRYNSHHH